MTIGHGNAGNWHVEEGAITGEQDPPGSYAGMGRSGEQGRVEGLKGGN